MSFVQNDPSVVKAAQVAEEERQAYCLLEHVARVGYAAVSELESFYGDWPPAWEELSDERQAELEAGCQFIFDHMASTYDDQHTAWIARNAHRLDPADPRRGRWIDQPLGIRLKGRIWRSICHAFIG